MSTPLNTLINQLSEQVISASSLCAEIKKTRHVGKTHTHLDLLEASLLAGPSYLESKSATLTSLSLSSNETAEKELSSYVSQLDEIIARLAGIAHPKGHHHHHHHQHRPLLFPDRDPGKHVEMEDPHFGELRAAWEAVRDGVLGVFGRLERGGEGEAVEEVVEVEEVKAEEKAETKGEGKVVVEEEKVELKEETAVVKEESAGVKKVVEVKVDEVVEKEQKSEVATA